MPTIVATRTGRALEVREYGDPAGRPVFFFHGLIGSHHQASYVAERAHERGLRIIAPNRPGVGASEFVVRRTALEAVDDVEDLAAFFRIDRFGVIGISGGTPYALAALRGLGDRVETVTILSGMGPARLRGSLNGMDRRRRLFFEVASRAPWLARRALDKAGARFRADPRRFLKALVRTWSIPDQRLFQREEVFELFLKDLEQVFIQGNGGAGMAQELRLYRDFGFRLNSLPADKRVTLWQGLDDTIVPPEMAWRMIQALPNREARFLPGGHFVAIDIAEAVTDRIRERLDGRE